jgi:hypothetical protein
MERVCYILDLRTFLIYLGKWSNALLEETYEGDYVNDLREGFGIFECGKLDRSYYYRYEGGFECDIFNGKGHSILLHGNFRSEYEGFYFFNYFNVIVMIVIHSCRRI